MGKPRMTSEEKERYTLLNPSLRLKMIKDNLYCVDRSTMIHNARDQCIMMATIDRYALASFEQAASSTIYFEVDGDDIYSGQYNEETGQIISRVKIESPFYARTRGTYIAADEDSQLLTKTLLNVLIKQCAKI